MNPPVIDRRLTVHVVDRMVRVREAYLLTFKMTSHLREHLWKYSIKSLGNRVIGRIKREH